MPSSALRVHPTSLHPAAPIATAIPAPPAPAMPFQPLTPVLSNQAPRDKFGHAVALSADGQTLAIGAPDHNEPSASSGLVQIYQRQGERWTPISGPILGRHPLEFWGWSIALASDGQTIAIGATGGAINGPSSGAVSIYRRVVDGGSRPTGGNRWVAVGAAIAGEAPLDRSGSAIALSADGQILAIGAVGNDTNGRNCGKVKVYQNIDQQWQQCGADLVGEQANSYFGSAIALSANGRHLAIGGPNHSQDHGPQNGAVMLYQRVNEGWQPMGRLVGRASREWFGGAVAMAADGQTIAVGAPGHDANRGAIRIYQNRAGLWLQLGDDLQGWMAGAGLGQAVGLSADGTTVAGSTAAIADQNGPSQVRTYRYRAQRWTIVGEASGGGRFGHALALSADGQTLAIGAPGHDQQLGDSGFVRLFAYRNAPPTITLPPYPITYAKPTAATPSTGQLIVPQAIVADDMPHFAGGRLQVQVSQGGCGGDRLSIQSQATEGNLIRLHESRIWYNLVEIATVTGGIGLTPLVLQFGPQADRAAVQAVIRRLTYQYVGNPTALTDRTIALTLTDGDGGISGVTQLILKITYQPEILLRHRKNQTLQLLYLDRVHQVTRSVDLTYGFGPRAGQPVPLANEWSIIDTLDINHDGIADLLLHAPKRDEVCRWQLGPNGRVKAIQSLQTPTGQILRTGNPHWRLVGWADLTPDQIPTIVWHNPVSDEVAFWFMAADGFTVTGYDYLRDRQGAIVKTGHPGWQIVAISDLDGNGQTDLLFHLAALNQTAIVRLAGPVCIDFQYLTPPPIAGLRVQSVQHHEGDQIAQIYWQSADQKQILVQSIGVTDGQIVSDRFAAITTDQPVQAIGDFDLDGTGDLLLQDPRRGTMAITGLNWDRSTRFQAALTQSGQAVALRRPSWEIVQVNEFGEFTP